MSKTGYRILEALADSEILQIQSPKTLAANLDYSRAHVGRELKTLTDEGLVERVGRGQYRITDAGRDSVSNT